MGLIPATEKTALRIAASLDANGGGQTSGTDADRLYPATEKTLLRIADRVDEISGGAIVVKTLSLTAVWSGSGPYTQTVTISGYTITANSKVDLQPDAAAIVQLVSDGVSALYVANNNGTLTAYAVGAAPTAALTVQCTITEVTT